MSYRFIFLIFLLLFTLARYTYFYHDPVWRLVWYDDNYECGGSSYYYSHTSHIDGRPRNGSQLIGYDFVKVNATFYDTRPIVVKLVYDNGTLYFNGSDTNGNYMQCKSLPPIGNHRSIKSVKLIRYREWLNYIVCAIPILVPVLCVYVAKDIHKEGQYYILKRLLNPQKEKITIPETERKRLKALRDEIDGQ